MIKSIFNTLYTYSPCKNYFYKVSGIYVTFTHIILQYQC